jgi:hypothetical protein
MDDFCALSRYAPNDIDTDAKRKEKFLNGLKGKLKIPLSVAYAPNYQSLLDQAITLDNNIMKEENRKRKFSNGKTHIGSSHKRHHFSEGNGNNGQHNHNSEAKKDLSHITCFNCKKKGHYSTNCPEPTKPNPFKRGHVNHIHVEEVMGTFPFKSFTARDTI